MPEDRGGFELFPAGKDVGQDQLLRADRGFGMKDVAAMSAARMVEQSPSLQKGR